MKQTRPNGDRFISLLIKLSGYSSILFVTLILLFLLREGLPALTDVPLSSIFSTTWYPIEGYFGVLPLATGSLLVTVGAMAVAVPLGIGTAVFISEIAPRWAREVLKPLVELEEEPEPPAPTAQPTQVKSGLYITQLYDIDISRKSFNITYWAWFLHDNDEYKPLDSVEIVNAKATTVRYPSTTQAAGLHYVQGKYYAAISQEYDVTYYPFDRQVLQVFMEDAQTDAKSMVFVADPQNSKIDPSLDVPGWTIEKFELKSTDVVYNTTYGDPTLEGVGDSTYSRLVATITVKRDGVRILCSLFVGFFVAFLLTSVSYFLDADFMAGARISLCAGGIFASAGNKLALDNTLAFPTEFTLADMIEISTFIAILVKKNPFPLTSSFEFANGAVADVSVRLKVAETSVIQAIAKADASHGADHAQGAPDDEQA